MNVFCLEEDVFFAEGLKRVFARHGLELTHLPKAEQGIERIEEEQPHVVLLDLCLSGATGFEVLAALKNNPRTKSIPIMVWSHVGSAEDVDRCFELGACEYFFKGHHEPREVAAHLVRYYAHKKTKPGFTLMEGLLVAGCLLLALAGLWWQIQRALMIRRDDGQMQAVRGYVSALIAAREERAFLTGCVNDSSARQPLYTCRVCKDEACRAALPVLWDVQPAYERWMLDPEHVCGEASTHPCHVAIERDGSNPISSQAFKLRFFLDRDRDGLRGGRTHTINAEGVVE